MAFPPLLVPPLLVPLPTPPMPLPISCCDGAKGSYLSPPLLLPGCWPGRGAWGWRSLSEAPSCSSLRLQVPVPKSPLPLLLPKLLLPLLLRLLLSLLNVRVTTDGWWQLLSSVR